jgi:hypothetical protein
MKMLTKIAYVEKVFSLSETVNVLLADPLIVN